MSGPAPKRAAERTRTADPKSGVARQGELRAVTVPTADKDWHPRARQWYNSLKTSGQSDYYQNSDWAYARIVADYLTAVYTRPRAMDWANLHSMMGRLGVTEGDRRQILRVELDAPDQGAGDVEAEAASRFMELLGKKQA